MLTEQKTETKHHFREREEVASRLEEWCANKQNVRIWFTDRHWLNGSPERYEVIVETRDK